MAASSKKKKSGMGSLVELVVTIAIAVGLAILIQALIVKPYRIPSGSMEPTVSIGQRVLANRLVDKPSIGDIVVFHPPQGAVTGNPGICGDTNQGQGHPQPCDQATPQESDQTFIKRVVAGPGDRMSIVDGHVIRNGKREKDSYIAECGPGSSCSFPKTITIPPGEWFMMGDNRGDSDDSRYWGPVPDKWLIGVAFFTYWPPDRIGTL
jgi:signal peptidase I